MNKITKEIIDFIPIVILFLIYNNGSNPRNKYIYVLFIVYITLKGIRENAFGLTYNFILKLFAIFFCISFHSYLINVSSYYAFPYVNIFMHIMYGGMLVLIYSDDIDKIVKNIITVLSVFVYGFIFQALVYYYTGNYVDLRNYISDAESKIGDVEVLNNLWGLGQGLNRFSSFFNEPGTYSYIVVQLMFLGYLYDRKLRLVYFFATASLFLTFSTFGIILGFSFMVYVMVDFYLRKRGSALVSTALIIASAFLLYSAIIFTYDYIMGRFIYNHKNDGGLEFRSNWLLSWADSSVIEILFGLGVGFWDIRYAYGNGIYIQDIGMWFHLLVNLGVIAIIFLYLLYRHTCGTNYYPMILLLLFSKEVFYSASYIATLAVIYIVSLNKRGYK